jgi:DNA polymerase-3 subunit gamma/tau
VPATILSRCQRFSFRRISQEDIAARLQYVAYQEKIDLDDSAARVLARMADGGLRDGLSLLDQCASATTGELTSQQVYACLGIAGAQNCAELMGYIAQKNTAKALELFNRLYAEGKDLGALLDEMACLTRDLLILKTAPNAGLTLLSGVADDAEAMKLKDAFSAGELVRMMEKLEGTLSAFTRSASRRMDAELCIISLCQPELQLDEASLNARLTRLEEQVKSGSFTVAAQPAEPVKAPEIKEEKPAPKQEKPVVEEATQPVEVPAQEAPVGFWTDLVSAVRQELRPPVSGFFITSPNAPVQGQLVGDKVVLSCNTSFTTEMVNKPEILAMVSRKAAAILGRPVRVEAIDRSAAPAHNAGFQQLINFGREHSDIVSIKE